jgi:hypothetical protein
MVLGFESGVVALEHRGEWSLARFLAEWKPGELGNARPSTLTHDDPANDGTDKAHPAWGRGYSRGLAESAERALASITYAEVMKRYPGTEPDLARYLAEVTEVVAALRNSAIDA